MKPSHVFGIVIRMTGVLLWLGALWQIYRAVVVLAGRTSWVDTYGHAFYDHLIPAIGLVVAGIVLLRGSDWLRKYAFQEAVLSEASNRPSGNRV